MTRFVGGPIKAKVHEAREPKRDANADNNDYDYAKPMAQ
jgi:hypothetical protein